MSAAGCREGIGPNPVGSSRKTARVQSTGELGARGVGRAECSEAASPTTSHARWGREQIVADTGPPASSRNTTEPGRLRQTNGDPGWRVPTCLSRPRLFFRRRFLSKPFGGGRKPMMDTQAPRTSNHCSELGPHVAWLSCIALVYVLSVGPAWALAQRGVISKTAVMAFYRPLGWLECHCPGDLLWRYCNWWAPWSP